MEIRNDRKLQELQDEFQEKFPFLKIEFYSEPHDIGEGSPEKVHLDADKTIAEVRTNGKKTEGFMSLDGDIKVGVFEKMFYENFGVSVQVFRKSYGKWLQTWATDVWTLQEQNRRGQILGER